jgi:hypothetical protein
MNYPMQSSGLGGLNTVQNMSDRNMMETLMANGGQRFASGGISNIPRMAAGGIPTYTYDPITGKYTQIDGVTAASSNVPKYTYDPVTQKYTLVTDNNPINNSFAKNGSGSGSDGGQDVPLDPRTAAFLDNEANIPGARDARMGKVSDFISMVVPGGMAAKALSGALSSPIVGGIANFFDPPASQPNYGVPVDSRGTYSNNPMGLTSYQSGVGNPAEQGSDTGGGEGIGGGDISGQSEGTPALAQGGIANLGDYSDGGRLLRGPGDGVSDSIPATIANKQPARLADGEFVVPARIVSELGNGSTEAGARKLYQMLARVQNARKKSIGQGRVAVNSRAEKLLPA